MPLRLLLLYVCPISIAAFFDQLCVDSTSTIACEFVQTFGFCFVGSCLESLSPRGPCRCVSEAPERDWRFCFPLEDSCGCFSCTRYKITFTLYDWGSTRPTASIRCSRPITTGTFLSKNAPSWCSWFSHVSCFSGMVRVEGVLKNEC